MDFGLQFDGKVTRLDSIAEYYLILTENENDFYKIVSEKVNEKRTGTKIQLDSIYRFKINQITNREAARKSNKSGIPTPINYMDIAVCRFFGQTEICTESSFELATASNLNGLYITEIKNAP